MILLVRTIYAGWGCPGRPGHLSREAGTLDGLGAFLYFVLIAAPMQGHHFTGPGPDMVH